MSKYELLLLAEFSAAHRLRLPDGTFEPLHGHNWRVEVYLEGATLDATGLLADFTVLEPRLNEVVGKLHNTYLNEVPVLSEANPSTELVAKYIHDEFSTVIPKDVTIAKVRVWETSTCAAAYLPK